MKHITPQAQNHIFKERRGRKPVPFQEISHGDTGFITLDELKVLEKRGKNTMDSDSDSDDQTSVSFVDAETNDKNTETNDETNDDTLTTDEKETEEEEEDLFEDDDEATQSEIADRNDDEKNEEKEELGLKPERFTVKNNLKKKQKKLTFTMNYEQIEDEW